MSAWLEVLVYLVTVLLGIFTNFLIAAWYAGKYKERVDKLTGEVLIFKDKVDALERKFAALTGQANGMDFRKEGD